VNSDDVTSWHRCSQIWVFSFHWQTDARWMHVAITICSEHVSVHVPRVGCQMHRGSAEQVSFVTYADAHRFAHVLLFHRQNEFAVQFPAFDPLQLLVHCSCELSHEHRGSAKQLAAVSYLYRHWNVHLPLVHWHMAFATQEVWPRISGQFLSQTCRTVSHTHVASLLQLRSVAYLYWQRMSHEDVYSHMGSFVHRSCSWAVLSDT